MVHQLHEAIDIEFDGRKVCGKSSGGDGIGGSFAPGNFENQCCGEGRGRKNIVGINSALEAVGGIRSEEKAARSAADFRSGEVCGFEKDVGGAFADSAIESSHHAGEGKGGSVFVGDEAIVLVEFVRFFVEGEELFSLGGLSDVDRA